MNNDKQSGGSWQVESLGQTALTLEYLRWLWLAAVIAASISPRAIKFRLHTVGALHTFSHISAFALGAILMCRSRSGDRPSVRSVLWLAGLALASEFLEAAVYGSRMEWNDVSLDMAGVFFGLGALYLRQISFLKVKGKLT